MLKQLYATRSVDEIFGYANTLSKLDQLKVFDFYVNSNANLKKLINAYKTPLPDWVADLDYRQPMIGSKGYNTVYKSASTLSDLLYKPSSKNKQRLEAFMETITIEEMMWVEHYLQGSLEDYYPKVNWDFFEFKKDKDAA